MPTPRYNIGVIAATANPPRASFLRALQARGHDVATMTLSPSLSDRARACFADGRFPGGFKPDFLLLFCMSYVGMHESGRAALFFDSFPYVTVWDSNPLRFLSSLAQWREHHVAMLVLDSQIVDDLHELGYPQARYFPYAYADPTVFRPMSPEPRYQHDLAFAGTSVTATPYPIPATLAGDAAVLDAVATFEATRNATRDYVDVYRFLRERLDVTSRIGSELSTYLMYRQKQMERTQLFATLDRAGLVCHVYGGAQVAYPRRGRTDKAGRVDRTVQMHPFLDKHRELPRLYSSASVHLCCTQFPRACHERAFQAAGCEALLLHEWKDDVPGLFEPGREVVLYRDGDELPGLIRYYQRHESERRRIGEQARRRLLAEHTPGRRAETFEDMVRPCIEAYRDRHAAVA